MSEFLVYVQSHITLLQVIEIAIMAAIIYKILSWIQGTQAQPLVYGLILIVGILFIARVFGFNTFAYNLQTLFTWSFLLLIIVFQPELRSTIEHFGRFGLIKSKFGKKVKSSKVDQAIAQICTAVENLSQKSIGALILCEKEFHLNNISVNGTIIDASIKSQLLENIFFPNSPLHDGAAVISIDEDMIIAAGCYIPDVEYKKELPLRLGARHRAGIFASTKTDAFVIIVSEETGHITIAQSGVYTEDIEVAYLKEVLEDLYSLPQQKEEKKSFNFFKKSQKEEVNELSDK